MMKPNSSKSSKRAGKAGATDRYFCGIDIGGTFTDCVLRDTTGQLTIAKAPSTPANPAEGFFAALEAAAARVGIPLGDLLSRTELLLHGTTLGTNALVEMKGARSGLITTRGHADALIMMRSVGRSAGLPIQRLLHVSRHRKPEPIIPRSRIREVSERVDWSGEIVLPLNEAEARTAITELREARVQAIGVCFLWGFLNRSHELAVKQMIQEMAPSVFVTCGHDLIAKPGEYERTAAVAINSFIGPLMSSYLGRIEERARELGYRRPLLIMQSSGGVATAEEVSRKPVFTIGSGPAGGLTASKYLADLLGHRNVIASDVGGTSFDVGLIHQGQPLATGETTVQQYTFSAPQLEIISIGSGGGSLIWVDESSRTLKVGPDSAGAHPGPACYGRGGEHPTITDANLLLGSLNADFFLGGRLHLDREAASLAMARVGLKIGLDEIQTASGAVQIVEFQMAELMRQMTVQRGLDPRDFVVYAYGGAAGVHAATYAAELGCRTVVVPLGATASTWSALGVQSADLLHVFEKSELLLAPYNVARMNQILARLDQQGTDQLLRDGVRKADIALERTAEMKFRLQIHQVEVPVPPGRLNGRSLQTLEQAFVEKYERLHGKGSAFTAAGIEIGLLRVVARGSIPQPALPRHRRQPRVRAAAHRNVYWREQGRFRRTPVYDGGALGCGAVIAGPAVLQMPETTVLLRPGNTGRVDHFGNLLVTVSK